MSELDLIRMFEWKNELNFKLLSVQIMCPLTH